MPLELLLAEDEAVVRTFICRALAGEGAVVTAVGSGEELLEAWRKTRCRRVLSDVAMPGRLDGIGACLEIRKLDASVVIHMMTGDPAAAAQAAGAGLSVAFAKPFTLAQLRSWFSSLAAAAPAKKI